MKLTNFRLFLMLFLDNTTTKKFLIGVWIGLAFSIAVILSTIGIMDGFERTLRYGLKKSSGDVTMQSRHGFFQDSERLKKDLAEEKILHYSTLVQTESFMIFDDESRGVVVKAITPDYGKIVELPLELSPNSAAIGSEIAKINRIKIGDEIVLAFAKGGSEFKNMPSLSRFKVERIISHGVYQKDARTIYVRLSEIQSILNLSNRINMIAFNIDRGQFIGDHDLDLIKKKVESLDIKFGMDFYFKPYWKEFSTVIQAAQAEKVLISLILQLIVVISIFNVLAFIYFINEKKAKELFLFKALGLSKKAMNHLWIKLVLLIWVASSLLAMVFVQVFRFLLLKVSLFELPAEIYHMPRIDIYLSWGDYALVFALALIWILLITYYLLWKLKNKSLLEGLRQEFV